MTRQMTITHEFVDYIPDAPNEGTVYVCIPFATAVHKCCCGCGIEVVTPLSPTDWRLIFDGQSISLDPSVGNWSFPCQSHYWIRRNSVVWARRWSRKEIEDGRAHDQLAKESYFDSSDAPIESDRGRSVEIPGESKPEESLLRKLKRWLS
jgi:hypothetical protein